MRSARRDPTGSALIAVLWSLVLLSLAVYSVLHTTRIEVRLVKNHGDSIQAHYLALAAIEKAKAVIYEETQDRLRGGQVSLDRLLSNPRAFRDVSLGRGLFRVLRRPRAGEGPDPVIYGLSDEESRLNANVASLEELKKLPGMDEATAAAIVDWRDRDNQPSPGGAEWEYYASLSPPYRPRNGPLESVREMLMIRGVTPEQLLGRPAAGPGRAAAGGSGLLEGGWSEFLTVDSSVENTNARGKLRTDIRSASEEALTSLGGISSDLAKAIVAYRGLRAFQSLTDLLDVTPVRKREAVAAEIARPAETGPAPPQGGSSGAPPPRLSRRGAPPPPPPPEPAPGPDAAAPATAPAAAPPGGSAPGQGGPQLEENGPKLVSEALFKEIADDITVMDGRSQEGAVNINTASQTVLACLPGVGPELAHAIVERRQVTGGFTSIADLLDVSGMTREVLKGLAPRVAARSETFRIVAEGLLPATGARRRIEAVVRLGTSRVETLSWREE